MAGQDPWAAPDQTWASPSPPAPPAQVPPGPHPNGPHPNGPHPHGPPPQGPPAAGTAPPRVPVPSPYAAPPELYGSFALPAAPLPAWAYPAPVPPRLGPALRPDPFTGRQWQSRPDLLVRLLVVLALGLLALGGVSFGAHADERAYQRYEKGVYEPVRGTVFARDDRLWFNGSSPGIGTVEIELDPYGYDAPGDVMTVLVARDDPTTYLLPGEEAEPVAPLVVAILLVSGGLVAGAAAVAVHRGRRAAPDAVRQVAARAPATATPPPPGEPPLRYPWLAASLGGAVLLALTAVSSARVAARPSVAELPSVETAYGEVVAPRETTRTRLEVRFYDRREGRVTGRVLTDAELARGARPGENIDVTYRAGTAYFDDGDRIRFGLFAGALALAAALLAWRAVMWRVRLRRAAREPAAPVDVVAWVRVARGRSWLVLWPEGVTHLRQAVAVPLVGDRELPAAFAGRVHLHGRRKGGHAVVVREPDGGALWPSGPARGALFAEATLVPVVPPGEPRPWGGWYPPPAMPQHLGG